MAKGKQHVDKRITRCPVCGRLASWSLFEDREATWDEPLWAWRMNPHDVDGVRCPGDASKVGKLLT